MHPSTTAPTPRERLLRLPAVEADTGLKKSAIYAGVSAGTFPRPVRLSRRFVAWRESDVQAWIKARCEEAQP